MQIVTARDFRANQKKYFDLAEKEPVFVLRRGSRPLSISAVNDDDLLPSEVLQSIARGLDDIKHGRVHRVDSAESLDTLLDSLE